MLWAALISLLAAVAVALLYPLWWRTTLPLPSGLEGAEAEQALADEKRRLLGNLRRLRYDYAEGRVAAADYNALEAEYQQQLATVMDGLDRLAAPPNAEQDQAIAPRKLFHRAGALIVLLLLAVPTLYIFNQLQPSIDEMGGRTSLEGALQQLENRLANNPNNAEGWVLAARTYEAMDKKAEALNAWSKVLTLQPDNREAMFSLALALIQSENAGARQKGLEYLDALLQKEPDAPALLWYRGLALFGLERKTEARATWQKLLERLPPDGENTELVREALKKSGP